MYFRCSFLRDNPAKTDAIISIFPSKPFLLFLNIFSLLLTFKHIFLQIYDTLNSIYSYILINVSFDTLIFFAFHMLPVEIDECESGPCQNGAECQDRLNGYHCACADGYQGTQCQGRI